MNLRNIVHLIRSSKNLTVGLGLSMLIITAACQVYGQGKQKQLTNPSPSQTSQIMAKNSQLIEPITTINLAEKDGKQKKIAISRDYQTIALVSPDKTIQIREITTNKLIKTLPVNRDSINMINWSPDGKTLASGSSDNTIKIWDVSTAKIITTITGYNSKVQGTYWVWSPDSKNIAIIGADKKIQIWDAKTSQLLQTITGMKDTNYPMSWSPDSKKIALANSGTIKIWDTNTGQLIQTLNHKFTSSVVALTGFNWSPDSQKIASTSVAGTLIWDVTTGKQLQEIAEINMMSAVWSPDGKTIAMGGQQQKITIWDITTGKSQTLYGHGFFVTNFAWSTDGKILISVGLDNTIKIWDTTKGKRLKTLAGHDGGIRNIRWNPQTKILASTGHDDNTIKLWSIDLNNLVENKLIQDKEISDKISFPAHKDAITSLLWSPDGKTLASSDEGGKFKLWDTSTGKSLNTLNGNQKMAITDIAWNPNGKTFATSGREKIVKKVSGNSSVVANEIQYSGVQIAIWDTTTGKSLRTIDVGESDKLVWSPDGKILATSGENNIRLWDATTGQLLKTINGKFIYHNFAWSPDGKTIVGYDLNMMKFWDVTTGKLSKTFTGLERELSTGGGETGNMVRAITWSRDGKLIATTDVSRTIQIWDAITGKFVKSLTGHGSAVLDVVWSDDSKTLASVSQDKTIKRWDISTGKEIETVGINLPLTLRVFWSPDGKKLAAGEWFNLNNNQRIQVWDINLSQF